MTKSDIGCQICCDAQRGSAVRCAVALTCSGSIAGHGIDPAVQGRGGAIHSAGLPLPCGRRGDDQLPPVAVDAFMPVVAFCGLDVMKRAYAHAIEVALYA
jgi:hypothetical protein